MENATNQAKPIMALRIDDLETVLQHLQANIERFDSILIRVRGPAPEVAPAEVIGGRRDVGEPRPAAVLDYLDAMIQDGGSIAATLQAQIAEMESLI